jgi:hypothetical protein
VVVGAGLYKKPTRGEEGGVGVAGRCDKEEEGEGRGGRPEMRKMEMLSWVVGCSPEMVGCRDWRQNMERKKVVDVAGSCGPVMAGATWSKKLAKVAVLGAATEWERVVCRSSPQGGVAGVMGWPELPWW